MWKRSFTSLDQLPGTEAEVAVLQTIEEEGTKKSNRSTKRMYDGGKSTVKMNMDPVLIK
jgi:hypothetical protein